MVKTLVFDGKRTVWEYFKWFFFMFNKTSFSSQKHFSIFWPFSHLKLSMSVRFCDQNEEKQFRLWSKTSYHLVERTLFWKLFFLTISPWNTENPETSLCSAGGFSKVSKLTKDLLIVLAKFSNFIPLDALLIPLCFI